MRIRNIILASALLIGVLCGCSDELSTDDAVKSVYGSAEYVSQEQTVHSAGVSETFYTYKYSDVEFDVTERSEYSVKIPGTELGLWGKAKRSADYGQMLAQYLRENTLSELSGGKLDDDKLWIRTDDDPNDVYISCKVSSPDELDETIELFKTIYDTIYDYLPDNAGGRSDDTANLAPHVNFAMSVPIDDEGSFFDEENSDKFSENGSIMIFVLYSKEDIIDWSEVQRLTEHLYNGICLSLAEKGLRSTPDLPNEVLTRIRLHQRSEFTPVWYSPKSRHTPTWDNMSTDTQR